MSPGSFNLIRVFKETTVGEKEYSKQNTPTKPISLLKLGYECDTLLSFESSLVFHNDKEKKLILVLDCIVSCVAYKVLDNFLSLDAYDKFFSHYKKRDMKTKNLFLEIKKKYTDYQKICLGYSLGGILTNKYMDDDYIKGYIYSTPCNTDTTKNIISYKLETDLLMYPFETYTNKNNIIIKNNLLNILKIFDSKKAFFKQNHQLNSLDESEIHDIIF
jgi:hypothetical protein